MKTQEQQIAEQATGCTENRNGLGPMYAGAINRKGMVTEGGYEASQQEAMDYLMEGGEVAFPNAGAGSWRKAFEALGFSDAKVIEWTSSAGDWTFGVSDGFTWWAAFQSNRFPRCGFSYSINREYSADTFEQLYGFYTRGIAICID